MFFEVILFIFIVWLLKIQWKRQQMKRILKVSPLPTLPLIGHTHHFIGGGEVRMEVMQTIGRQAIEAGGWSAIWLGTTFITVVTDAVEAEYVLKTHLEKDDLVKITQPFLGNGLIFAPVSIWRPRRKVLAPTFSQNNLNQFVDVFYKQSCILADNLSQVSDQKPVSLWDYLTGYTMDSICETTLGTNMCVQNKQDHIFRRSFQEWANIICKRAFIPGLFHEMPFKIFCYFGLYQKYRESVMVLRKFVSEIIINKRAEIKEHQAKTTSNNDVIDKPNFKPILELLIKASGGDQGYTNTELQEEAQVLLIAGTDTSAVGSCFVALMLAKYPDIQEKVYNELNEVLGDRPVTSEDIPRLSYLEAVIKETLRLYPPVPIIMRKVEKDCVSPGGQVLKAGMTVIIHQWAIHRNAMYWGKDAEEFRPERFFDSPPTHASAYIPFSYGARNCIGYKYAMISMTTATATLVRQYQLKPADLEQLKKPLRCSFEIMMKDVDNFQLRLKKRDR